MSSRSRHSRRTLPTQRSAYAFASGALTGVGIIVIRTIRADCLDRILILGRRQLDHALRVYRRHDNEHRPHRALHLLPPNGRDPTPLNATAHLRRRDLLGGLIHEYDAA